MDEDEELIIGDPKTAFKTKNQIIVQTNVQILEEESKE